MDSDGQPGVQLRRRSAAALELAFTYAFGSRFEHVLSMPGLGVNVYSAVFSGPSAQRTGLTADGARARHGGAAGYFGLGYTYRFNTPFGNSPFVMLE